MTDSINAWIVDDDASIRWVLKKALRHAGIATRDFEDPAHFLQAMERHRPDVVITDIRMPTMDGIELLERVQQRDPQLPVIVITAHSDLDSAVSAYQGGAFEYLPKPFDVDEAVDLVRRAASQTRGAAEQSAADVTMPGLIGTAPAMQELFRAIGRLSRSSMTVLITGESGTGKELVASALHRHSPRASGPFIAINTSAIPADLLESELFGHERGAFTGAESRRQGRFEQADGGTLFLDEIGDMPPPLQTRLLRVLAEGEFYRVGGQRPIRVNVRVIAATHQNLEARVTDGTFREDLFHRLNVIRVQVPALRDRREDVRPLLEHYLAQAAAELGCEAKRLTPEAARRLGNFDWPGNVRELVNACRRLTVLAPGGEIRLEDIPAEFGGDGSRPDNGRDWASMLGQWARQRLSEGRTPILSDAVPQFERTLIRAALHQAGGRRQKAAQLLGWGRNTLTRKIRDLQMD